MSPSNKHALVQYLQFLKSSGFLYLENGPDDLGKLDRSLIQTTAVSARVVSRPVSRRKSGGSRRDDQEDLLGGINPVLGTATPLQCAFDGPDFSVEERREKLLKLADQASACRACPLGSSRIQAVFSDGDPDAKLMFVGEAPGEQEDIKGIPFVGRAGQLLTKMVEAIGFKRNEVYICNTLKCRPPDNRDPKPSEKDACEHFLLAQIGILRPSIMVALGAHAAQYLCRSNTTIGKLRGRWHNYRGVPLLATYHPAFLLRSPGMKSRAWDDFRMIHAQYARLNPDDTRDIWMKK